MAQFTRPIGSSSSSSARSRSRSLRKYCGEILPQLSRHPPPVHGPYALPEFLLVPHVVVKRVHQLLQHRIGGLVLQCSILTALICLPCLPILPYCCNPLPPMSDSAAACTRHQPCVFRLLHPTSVAYGFLREAGPCAPARCSSPLSMYLNPTCPGEPR